MKSVTEVTREIRRIVTDKVDAGATIRVEWLTTEIIAQKDAIEGDDVDFYLACGVDFVKRVVKKVIGEYDPQVATNEQLVMDGFTQLQKAYTVRRNDEIMLVPIHDVTDAELELRAQEYDAMAKGCIKHAQEIRVYARSRANAA